jgi:hypothetical protein
MLNYFLLAEQLLQQSLDVDLPFFYLFGFVVQQPGCFD